jgi:N-methylhydantoinase A
MPLLFEGSVEGMPLQSPWVDVRSIGAGGGSVSYVDVGGLLRVGPRSAGAVPGPACYQRGGTEPTVTDAAVLLGMFRPGTLSGGVTLSTDFARRALEPLAQPAGLPDAHAVADGVLRIAAAHMAQAIRGITVERGIDPRGATLVAFGGAGPLFACLIADELDIDRIVVPPNAGNFSAVGLLSSDVTRAAGRTFVRRLDAEALDGVRAVADQLLVQLDPDGTAGIREVSLDLRYAGQEHVLTRVLGPDRVAEDVIGDFRDEYRRVFGHQLAGDVEVVTVRVAAQTPLDLGGALVPAPPAPPRGTEQGSVWSIRRRTWLPAQILTRADLGARGPLAGPLIVAEATATTYVDEGFTAEIDGEGCLMVARKEQP